MCEFTSWNMVESTFELIAPMDQDAEKALDPDLNWVLTTETTIDGSGEMQSEASASSPLNASQPLIVNGLHENDPICGNLVSMETLLHVPAGAVLTNQPPGSMPITTSTKDTETTVSSSTTMRVALRNFELQGTQHLVPGNYILPPYMLQPGFPVHLLRSLDVEFNGKVHRLYILPTGSCSNQTTTTTPGGGLKEAQRPLVKGRPQLIPPMGASMDRNGDKENLRDDVSSSGSSVSTVTTHPETSTLREYLELQINNITIPVLPAGSKKFGTKHSRKAAAQK